MHENYPEFDRKIILNDEPHFHCHGYVGSRFIAEKPLLFWLHRGHRRLEQQLRWRLRVSEMINDFFFCQNWIVLFWSTFNWSTDLLRENFRAVLSSEEVLPIAHHDLGIKHLGTSSFRATWEMRSTPISQRRVIPSKMEFVKLLMAYSSHFVV